MVSKVEQASSFQLAIGFARGPWEQEIEKITVSHGVTHDEVRGFILVLGDRGSPIPAGDRLAMRGVRAITIGKVVFEETDDDETGITAARLVDDAAVETAEKLWNAAKTGEQRDPGAVLRIIDSLAKLVTQDRTSLMALTALKTDDNTWERDSRGEHARVVVEALDPEGLDIDPLTYM